MAQAGDPAVFFYDFADPEGYLAAEQLHGALGLVPEWEPVLTGAGMRPAPAPDPADLARRAQALGLQPLRWPAGWPPQTRTALLAATYAKQAGRVVAFSLAAFRQAFAGGRDLGEENTVLIAAAACELHPAAVLKALTLRSVGEGLDGASRRALESGVEELPALALGGEVFSGAIAVRTAMQALSQGV
jgi:2-hydroxychromene-2-carboxylate isomerase